MKLTREMQRKLLEGRLGGDPLFRKGRKARRFAKKQPGEMNGTEKAYAELLKAREARGDILGWAYERITLHLAPRCTYTPDFIVFTKDEHIQLVDVKALTKSGKILMEDDARVKIKVADQDYPFFEILIAAGRKEKNGWFFQEMTVDLTEKWSGYAA